LTRDRKQLEIFGQGSQSVVYGLGSLDWPSQERFPLNVAGRHVRDQVVQDLVGSATPLIVTGYAAIDHVVEFLSQFESGHSGIRLLFGSEPSPGRPERYGGSGREFSQEVRAYWLSRGISPRLSLKLIQAVERLERGEVEARYLGDSGTRLHAKIYRGDLAVTLGSSNFTQPGLVSQLEANVRFTATYDKARFREASAIAENYWSSGTPYTKELIDLLNSMLRWVTWQEALARACAELLEGQWAKDYLDAQPLAGDQPLWPSQQQGIAQALWILETVGSVLVSDATGSGKTRLGAHLLRAVMDRIWKFGRIRRGRAVVVAPPAVARAWQAEATLAGTQLEVRSHGKLSRSDGSDHDEVVEAVRRAQVLAVDEAHNFLNRRSERSRVLLSNMADHTILFTATPINRNAADLLRLADVLGADNLAAETLEAFEDMLRHPNRVGAMSEQQLGRLRSELRRFTVRRTKTMLNALVNEAPEKYRDVKGKLCRYPRHNPEVYQLHESTEDRRIAAEIRVATTELTGAALITKAIELPVSLRQEGWSEEKFLHSRLNGARRLSSYLVMSALRSSSCALIEHLIGTTDAILEFELKTEHKRQETGNVIGKLESRKGKPPGSHLSIPDVPAWLTDADEHLRVCEADLATYRHIVRLVRAMSDRREMQKVALLAKLTKRHAMVVAFDSRPISLAVLRNRLRVLLGNKHQEVDVILATGERAASRKEVSSKMRRGAGHSGALIAMCSDSMSEGVNLQEASVVVHLDMPSVVRVAEQRVGRVDRMDSPHKSIQVWWPQDAKEFALRSDERFLERYATVESLLGSNLPLPEALGGSGSDGRDEVISAEAMIKEAENVDAEPWDGIQDAFSSVRDLVDGPTRIVPAETYRDYREVTERVLARVSCVRSEDRWALLCFAGSALGAPRWVLFREHGDQVTAELDSICHELRGRLGPERNNLEPTERAMKWLERAVDRVHTGERDLLPRRKQRALEEMALVLGHYKTKCEIRGEHEDVDKLRAILSAMQDDNPELWIDWDLVAERWLDLIRPVWYESLTGRRKQTRPLLLRDVRAALKDTRPLKLTEVFAAFLPLPTLQPLDERLAACILGIPE